MEFQLTLQEKEILLQTAREAISARLENRKPAYPEPTELLKKKCGAFVTLHKGGALRGCIGYVMAGKPLIRTVVEVAQSSAFNDPRFPALSSEEFTRTAIEISVLSPFLRVRDVNAEDQIKVGRHGLFVLSRERQGLLLPQVPVNEGWDRGEFLERACEKAGLPADCWKWAALYTFTAEVFGEAREPQ